MDGIVCGTPPPVPVAAPMEHVAEEGYVENDDGGDENAQYDEDYEYYYEEYENSFDFNFNCFFFVLCVLVICNIQ